MSRVLLLILIVALAACRGERVPRDYQNAPPAMTHPPASKEETPSHHGMGEAAPQPDIGAEGTVAPRQPVAPPPAPATTTIPDTPPVRDP
jgi:hypothetical protein